MVKIKQNESYWSLGCILGFMGIPGMVIGDQLAKTYGVAFAVMAIVIGNFVLWVFGLGIVSMTEGKGHAIDNIRKQLGKTSAFLATLLFALAYIMWYAVQFSSAASRACQVFAIHEEWKVGAFLGAIVIACSAGGLKWIKRACVVGLPLLVGISLYYLLSHKSSASSYVEPAHFSFVGVLAVIMAWLAGTVSFPTVFRHARSKSNTIVALALIFLFHTFFQIATVFYGIDVLYMSFSDAKQNHMIFDFVLATLLSLISFGCMNLINVYFISACWEVLFPKDRGNKKYVICASVATFVYVLLEMINKTPSVFSAKNVIMYFNTVTCFMAILLISLLIHFLISLTVRHRVRYFTQFFGSMAWLIGCVVAGQSLMQAPEAMNLALISGVGSTMLFSTVVVFIEETVWSIKSVIARSRI